MQSCERCASIVEVSMNRDWIPKFEVLLKVEWLIAANDYCEDIKAFRTMSLNVLDRHLQAFDSSSVFVTFNIYRCIPVTFLTACIFIYICTIKKRLFKLRILTSLLTILKFNVKYQIMLELTFLYCFSVFYINLFHYNKSFKKVQFSQPFIVTFKTVTVPLSILFCHLNKSL